MDSMTTSSSPCSGNGRSTGINRGVEGGELAGDEAVEDDDEERDRECPRKRYSPLEVATESSACRALIRCLRLSTSATFSIAW
ncbi:hypothetical protein NUW54_g11738 [Trametes sanguinea]|uniref:Uncharacterized protein n=1 Tax=Trametes sanguinea TaxID=158606 RepID=A0ACC1N924_9APHY|nr:hypothetical protein NUW54_g11738 [Trametes sanguinea]